MARPQKVVWSEGMPLDPHHFQQWDRFHQANTLFRMRALQRNAWGVFTLLVDEEALFNGQFNLLQCTGIMPDGLIYDLPESDRMPDARNIQAVFDPTKEKLGVFLGIPAERIDGRNVLLPDAEENRATRYVTSEAYVRDDNSGVDERTIQIARGNFQILFENENMADWSTIKIAEVLRTQSGNFQLNSQYIPPCLSVSSATSLESIARRTLELLTAKRQALKDRHAAYGRGELTSEDVTTMLFLETVNGSIPEIDHHYRVVQSHPEIIYTALLRLAGYLTTYSDIYEIGDLPEYDHSNLTKCFNTLFQQFRALLGDVTFSKDYERIELKRRGESLYMAKYEEKHLPSSVELFLVCRGEISSDRMRSSFPEDIRIASPAMIEPVLKGFVKALEVKYVSNLPKGMPVRPDSFYYRLEKNGHFWDDIKAKKAMVLFVPPNMKQLDIELFALMKKS